MKETDIYEPIGEPVEGYQKWRFETPTWTSYPVLRISEDPNVEFQEDEGEPFPLVYTVQESDGKNVIQAEWNADTGLLDFANHIDVYIAASDTNLVNGPDNGVDLEVVCSTDEGENPSLKQQYHRPMDGDTLEEVLLDVGIVQKDISSVTLTHSSGIFMWQTSDRVSAEVTPAAFTELGSGMKALTDVFDATRNRETAPSVNVFADGLRLAAADSLFDLTSQVQPATV